MNTSQHRRTMIYLFTSNFMLIFGFRVWQTLFNNFAVEEIGVSPASIGLIQAMREIPGLLGFLLGFLAMFMSEIRIMALSVILMGVGLIFTGQSQSVLMVLLSTVVMSFGFHFFYSSSNSVVLMVSKQAESPKLLGRLGGLNAVAAVLGTIAVYLLASRLGYRGLFTVVGSLVVFGGLCLLPISRRGDGGLPRKRKVVLRRRYWLFYILAFLMGSRRHVFTTFAIFLLVREFGISVQTTAVLFLVNSLVNVFVLPWMGRLVGRLGERLVMSVGFALLALVFVGYAYVTTLPVLFALFITDNVLFGFNLALTTYFQKIAVTPEEITSNVSVQQTINHVAAIVVPIVGGAVWELFGRQAPFLVGAGVVLLSLVLVQFMRTEPRGEIGSVAAVGGGEGG